MPTEKWTDEFLDDMRHKMDPLADKAANALFLGQNKKGIFKQLKAYATNDAHVPDDFPIELKALFNEAIPDFTAEDHAKFKIANDVFDKYGYRIAALLFFKSLPTGYMCPAPAHVLGSTRLLEDQATRRVFETGQFLFDVNQFEWLEAKGRGINSIKKVRLMHAGMRGFLLFDNKEKWDDKDLGKPINQEDMVLTLQLFSLAIIDGLKKMGVFLTSEEQEAFFHKWKIVGRILGIHPSLEPVDVADGWALQNKILSRLVKEENPDGPELTKQLIGVLDEHSPFFIRHKSFEKIVYYFLDDKRAVASLGLHKPGFFELLFDKIIQKLVSSRLWKIIFPHHQGAKPKFKWLYTFIQKQFARRWGFKIHDKIDPKLDIMEVLCKIIVDKLEKTAKLSSNSTFKIHDKLIREWQLGGFDFSDADAIN
jgi:hypothetical protein